MSGTRVFLQTMITLASASLGLVAALAWNEAIKATIKKVLGPGDRLAALYISAVVATGFGGAGRALVAPPGRGSPGRPPAWRRYIPALCWRPSLRWSW